MAKVLGGILLSQVQDLRKALDKAIKGSDSAETVMDMLTAIEILPMTPDLIKDSKLGKILMAAKIKFTSEISTAASDVSNKARDILVEWKKIIEDHIKKEKLVAAVDKKTPPKLIDNILKIKRIPATEATALGVIRSEMASFPEARRKVILLLTGYLKLSTSDADKSELIAYNVDKAVDGLHSFDLDNKAYMGIIRSLAFNLKRNESLRSDLLSSALTAQLLVTLTPEDLATDELRRARQMINEADRESRRTDWLEEHKGKIQVGMGLDPSNVWEYDEEVESDAD